MSIYSIKDILNINDAKTKVIRLNYEQYQSKTISDFEKKNNQLRQYIKQFKSWLSSRHKMKNTNSCWLLIGPNGCGKSYYINTLLNNPEFKNYIIKRLDFNSIKQELGISCTNSTAISTTTTVGNFQKQKIRVSGYPNLLADILKRSLPENNLLRFSCEYEDKQVILLIDEIEDRIDDDREKKIIKSIISVNNEHKICPIISVFNDCNNTYIKDYKRNSIVQEFEYPSNDELYDFLKKIIMLENIYFKPTAEYTVTDFIKDFIMLCNNNYTTFKNNLNELLNFYSTIEKEIRKKTKQLYDFRFSITTDQFYNFFMTKRKFIKYVNEDYNSKIICIQKSNKIMINDIMDLFYNNVTIIPTLISNLYIKNVRTINNKLESTNNLSVTLKKNTKNTDSNKNIQINGYNNIYKTMNKTLKLLTYTNNLNNIIFKQKRTNLMKEYGYLSCYVPLKNMTNTIINDNNIIYNVSSQRNYTFFIKFSSISNFENTYLSQILHYYYLNNRKKFINIVKQYKLNKNEIIEIFKFQNNKLNFNGIESDIQKIAEDCTSRLLFEEIKKKYK